ncbi:ABC transporter permease [Lampropedia puyangensis]|uniref:ABC transporter permease n=1 Tax=Lampropedia puyangensis TaxID=1330072 RepID=A0A4V4GSM2_9BURK|nr:ABC transporter permease [Lampropedia puyangensis]THU04986.1 ABC transporter permease [Lampropedia puyangensis]
MQKTSASGALSGPWLATPLLVYFLIFVLAPQIVLVVMSFRGLEGALTLTHFARVLTDPMTYDVLIGTLRLGLLTTLLTLVIGYPYALGMVYAGPRLKSLLLLLVVLPLLVSGVVRTFGWMVALGNQGPINELLLWLGIIEQPLKLLFTEKAVVIGLTQIEMPMMVLALYTVLGRMDASLLLASRSLGAGHWKTLVQVILPLSIPGLIAGCSLVFASAVGSFVAQTVLGGGGLLYMPMYIYQQSILSQEWAFAAALAVVLMVAVSSIVFAGNALARKSKGYIYG